MREEDFRSQREVRVISGSMVIESLVSFLGEAQSIFGFLSDVSEKLSSLFCFGNLLGHEWGIGHGRMVAVFEEEGGLASGG